MDKEKEIEELAFSLIKATSPLGVKDLRKQFDYKTVAEALYNAGYRLCGGDSCPNFKHYEEECKKCTGKQEFITGLQLEAAKEQAVKEFVENKVKSLLDEIVELMFDDNRSVCQTEKCHKSDDIQCGASICIEENKQIWKHKLDELVKERFSEGGADDKTTEKDN